MARLPPGDACFSLYRWIWLRSAVLGTNSLTGSGSPVSGDVLFAWSHVSIA